MNYWAVGAVHGDTDVFLGNGIWYDGYAEDGDDRNRDTLERVAIGDLLLMKSSATKGVGHKLSLTKLKAIGSLRHHPFFDINKLAS